MPLPVTLLNVFLGGLLLLKLILWRQGRWSAATRWAQFTVGLLGIVVIGATLSTAGAPTIDAGWFRARGWVGDYPGALAAAGKVSRILHGCCGRGSSGRSSTRAGGFGAWSTITGSPGRRRESRPGDR